MRIEKKIDTTLLETVVSVSAKSQKELDTVVNHIACLDDCILGTLNGATYRISWSEILYFESVDKRSFAYTQKDVYEISERLYELEKVMPNKFFRCSKSAIVNIGKIDSFVCDFSGRIVAKMKNGEKIIVSRLYVKSLKEKLNGGSSK